MGADLFVLGCFLNLIGSITINVATNVIKYAHIIDNKKLWYTGIGIFAAGNIANFISMSFAPQSVLAALGSIQFVSNLFLAYFFLGEKLTRAMLIGTFMIVLGNIVIVSVGSKDSPQYSLDDLMDLFGETAFVVYICLSLALAVALQGVYMGMDRRMLRSLPEALAGVSFAASSAIIGSNQVLLAKSSSQLLRASLAGENQLTKPLTYVILLTWIGLLVFWMTRLNQALRLFAASFIIPVLQCFWTLFAILGGGIYFKEFDDFTGLSYSMFIIGLLLLGGGVVMLSPVDVQNLEDPGAVNKSVDDETSTAIESDLTSLSGLEDLDRFNTMRVRAREASITYQRHRRQSFGEALARRRWSMAEVIPTMPVTAVERSLIKHGDSVLTHWHDVQEEEKRPLLIGERPRRRTLYGSIKMAWTKLTRPRTMSHTPISPRDTDSGAPPRTAPVPIPSHRRSTGSTFVVDADLPPQQIRSQSLQSTSAHMGSPTGASLSTVREAPEA